MILSRVTRAPLAGRAAAAAYWTAPQLICLAVYWLGLLTWFHQDDFAWLGLRLSVHDWPTFWRALFAPMAQGTIRPLSERVFFMAFEGAFGLQPLPFRICVFLTQFVNLALVCAIARRLTGSAAAGVLAPVLWTANASLAVAMSWTSAYNQVLCGFFLLLSFWLLLRWSETGQPRYYVAQWITFLLGFGALEVNVMYPALAASYTLLCARRHFLTTLPLFVPSALFTVAHNAAAPKAASGAYAMHLDASMLYTLIQYWKRALAPSHIDVIAGWEQYATPFCIVLTVSLLACAWWKLRHGRPVAVFLIGWFLILLLPVLPLRDHISEYYLTLPTIGLAILAGWGFADAWKSRVVLRIPAIVLAAAYLAWSVPVAVIATEWRYERALMVRNLLWGVERVRELHPGKAILLAGIGSDLFWSAIVDKPFRLLGINDVYLTPGTENNIEPQPELGDPFQFVLPQRLARQAIEDRRAVVYSVSSGRLVNVTDAYLAYARTWKVEEPRRVDVGRPEFAAQLGPTWYPIEAQGHRWMPEHATVRLGGPSAAGQKLTVSGYISGDQLKDGPVHLTVSVDGVAYPPVALNQPGSAFEFAFPLSKETLGKESVEISVDVDRTFTPPGDGRRLGAVFGVFAIR